MTEINARMKELIEIFCDADRRRSAEQGGDFMKAIWNPLAYISDYGWTCIVCVAGLLFAAMVLAG